MSKNHWIAGIPIYSECARITTTAEGREAVLKLATPANRTEVGGVTRTHYHDTYTLAEARDCIIELINFKTDDREVEAARKALVKVFETAYTRLGGDLQDLPQKGRNGFNTQAKAGKPAKSRTAPANVVVAATQAPRKGARRTARPS